MKSIPIHITSRSDNSGNELSIGLTGTLDPADSYLAYLLSGGVVLDQFAVLHAEARPHPIDLLVDLSPVVVSLLTSTETKKLCIACH